MKTRPLSALITVGQRGTLVIPADLRKEMGIDCGSKLMVIWDGESLKLTPTPSDDLERLQWAFGRAYQGIDAEAVLKELRNDWPD